MTYTPTHLTLQGIILWNLLPKKQKDYFKEHRWDFIIINLFAIFPDIDILFGAHRTYTHSIILPTFLLLIVIILDKLNSRFILFENRGKKIVKILKYSMLMWGFHISLDFGWDALLLFWPLDNHFYDFTLYFRFGTESWWILPLVFIGVIPSWRLYSRTEGQNMFFINLSQQQRESIFGQYIDLTIPELSLHIFIFLTWAIIILLPALKSKRKQDKKKENRKAFYIVGKNLWRRVKRQLTGLGLFILLLGIVLGPIIGPVNTYSTGFAVYLVNTNSWFDPTLGFTIEREQGRTVSVEIEGETGVVEYNATLMLLDHNSFYNFFTEFELITQKYYNQTATFSELFANYQFLVNKTKATSYFLKPVTEPEKIVNVTLDEEATGEGAYYILYVIDEWNITQSFLYKISVKIDY
ncbi:MAG: hypothetical protein ACTSPI_08275 [Candidatus Heimdallarchaeaceae archaeon]